MPPRRGRPPRLTRDAILAAAAAMDYDDLTMTALASNLGVRHSALYHYFPTKADLMAALALQTARDLTVPSRADMPWQDWVVEIVAAMRDRLALYPVSADNLPAPLLAEIAPLGEALQTALLEQGFTVLETARAYHLLLWCAIGGGMFKRRLERQGHPTAFAIAALMDDYGLAPSSPYRALLPELDGFDVEDSFRRNTRAALVGLCVEAGLPDAVTQRGLPTPTK